MKEGLLAEGFEKWADENLDPTDEIWREPFTIPNHIKQLNIIADLHSVLLDKRVMIKFLKSTTNKEAILIDGDLLNSESLSRHLILHNVVDYEKEIRICRHILTILKQEFTHVYFKEGNHDYWLERYLLMNNRPLLNTFKEFGLNVKELLNCSALGVHHIHNLQYIQYGDLDIIHGHEFPGFGSSKFPATGLLDKWQRYKRRIDVKILQAHVHKADKAISKKSIDNKWGNAWTIPAMCHKSAQFSPYAGCDNGWAVVNNNDGIVDVELIIL